jgi:hypothetical protein
MSSAIPEGLHVRFFHDRKPYTYFWKKPNGAIVTKVAKGRTYCYLENEDNESVVTGVAYCSDEDHYNKSVGRAISMGRALKAYEELSLSNA